MPPSPPLPPKPDPAVAAGHGTPAAAARPGSLVQRSRIGMVWVGGHFDPAVAHALKTLALQQGTTVQALLGQALNDLLEKQGLGRPASELVLPRGAAAWRREPGR